MYEDNFLEMDYEDRFTTSDEGCPYCGDMGCYECDPYYDDEEEWEEDEDEYYPEDDELEDEDWN